MIGRTNTGGGGGASAPGGLPVFTYSGDFELIDDGEKNWRIKFYSGGTLNFKNLGKTTAIDVFCVGGGGGAHGTADPYNVWSGAGGGGGYTATKKNVAIYKATDYEIVIGSGGSGSYDANAGDGGDTIAFRVTANGGKGAIDSQSASNGGDGGSGGAGAAGNKNGNYGYGGEDGTGGTTTNYPYVGGSGQGTTTREFGEEWGTLYASGGDAVSNAASGGVNTGDGGSGAMNKAGGSGGSGIVVIRNKRG